MTINDIKRLDRRLREIEDPFGGSFPIMKHIFIETADQYKTSVTEVLRMYAAWKWKK